MTDRDPSPRPGGILFDLDGTLVDSRADLAEAVNAVRRRRGLGVLGQDVVASYVGDGVKALLERVLSHPDDAGRPAGMPSAADLAAALADFRRAYAAHLLDRTALYPGVDAMLAAVADRPLAVVTNKPREFTLAILDGLGIVARFAVVVGGDDVERRKPHPDHLQAALDAAGLSATQSVMVGDSPNDILPARALGLTSVAVTWGLTSVERLRAAEPDHLVGSATELAALLSAGSGGPSGDA